MDIASKITQIREKTDAYGATLVAVTKTHPIERIEEALSAGIADFGENRVQELQNKQPALPTARWHLIGHLQRNKVKYLAEYIHLIHSVEGLDLLMEINRQGQRANRVIPCLLQCYIAKEETKFGLEKPELDALLLNTPWADLQNISIDGLMGMATFTDNQTQVRNEFKTLRRWFEEAKATTLPPQVHMQTLSMGMSGDWQLALEEGSTMVRVGSAIFG